MRNYPVFQNGKSLPGRLGISVWNYARSAFRWAAGVSPTVLLIAVVIIVVAITVRSCDTNRQAAKDAPVIQKSIAAADRAETGTIRAKARIHQKAIESRARTEEALARNPDWASQPVPPDVLDSLRP